MSTAFNKSRVCKRLQILTSHYLFLSAVQSNINEIKSDIYSIPSIQHHNHLFFFEITPQMFEWNKLDYCSEVSFDFTYRNDVTSSSIFICNRVYNNWFLISLRMVRILPTLMCTQ